MALDLVNGAVEDVAALGLEVVAWQRWRDPQPGAALVVLALGATWSAQSNSASAPTLVATTYACPTEGQADAERIALGAAEQVALVLHRPAGGTWKWSGTRVLRCMLNGQGAPGEVEGHPSWISVRSVFEVLAG